jgi:hypothetical protein
VTALRMTFWRLDNKIRADDSVIACTDSIQFENPRVTNNLPSPSYHNVVGGRHWAGGGSAVKSVKRTDTRRVSGKLRQLVGVLVEWKKRGDKLQRSNLCLTELNERRENGKPKVCDFETHRGFEAVAAEGGF